MAEKTVFLVTLPEVTNSGIDLSPVLEIELTTRMASPVGLEEVKRVSLVPVLRITIPLTMSVDVVLFEELLIRICPTPESTRPPPAQFWPCTPAVPAAIRDAIEISPPPEVMIGDPSASKLIPGLELEDGAPPGGAKSLWFALAPPPNQMFAPPVWGELLTAAQSLMVLAHKLPLLKIRPVASPSESLQTEI